MKTIKEILDLINKILGERKGLAIVLLVCGCLFILGALFQVDDITKFKVTPRSPVAWPPAVAGAGLILAAALWARFVERSAWLRQIPSRDDYMRESIRQTRLATKSIAMCVHTLDPAGENEDGLRDLQNALAEKTRVVGGVKLLAPVGEERVAASLQLHKLGVSVRHLALLQNLGISSFSVFDSARAVLPTKSGDSQQTVAGVTVESFTLAGMLAALFGDLWSPFDVMPCPEFIRFTAGQIRQTQPAISLNALANRLKVDAGELRTLLPVFDLHETDFFLIIGRPCSGKTTVVSALVSALAQQGVTGEEVYYFNDYEALYERFHEDANRRVFTPAERGGFAVRESEFSILDTVLQQASFRLSTAAPFYRVCIVEFARNDYTRSLLNFGPAILGKSTVVHVQCSPKRCHERNEQRRDLSSDHRTGYIPRHILNTFYADENMNGARNMLERDIIGINTDQVPLDQLQTVIQTKLSLGAPP